MEAYEYIRKAFDIHIVSIHAFFDRNWNLLFNGKNCIKIEINEDIFEYQDVLFYDKKNLRYLGKSWYVLHER